MQATDVWEVAALPANPHFVVWLLEQRGWRDWKNPISSAPPLCIKPISNRNCELPGSLSMETCLAQPPGVKMGRDCCAFHCCLGEWRLANTLALHTSLITEWKQQHVNTVSFFLSVQQKEMKYSHISFYSHLWKWGDFSGSMPHPSLMSVLIMCVKYSWCVSNAHTLCKSKACINNESTNAATVPGKSFT